MATLKLHSYFNSSTSFRVRIALALKGVDVHYEPVNLRGGGQREPAFLAMNPSGGVPVLTDGDLVLTQSLAIIDYLDQRFPTPRLVPMEVALRARVLELSLVVACDIHPVNNMRVQKALRSSFGANEEQLRAWYQHWVAEGLTAAEALLQDLPTDTPCCFGDEPTLAECCLVPQVYNSLRMGCQLDSFPRVMAVYEHCMKLPAFVAASPARQPDSI